VCITWCHRRLALFYNHEDCLPQFCAFVGGPHHPCQTCRHRQGNLCGLTRAPLPETGGCCHHNVEPISGRQPITLDMLVMLGVGANETVAEILDGFEVVYEVDEAGRVWVDPDDLSTPSSVYGRGTDCL